MELRGLRGRVADIISANLAERFENEKQIEACADLVIDAVSSQVVESLRSYNNDESADGIAIGIDMAADFVEREFWRWRAQ